MTIVWAWHWHFQRTGRLLLEHHLVDATFEGANVTAVRFQPQVAATKKLGGGFNHFYVFNHPVEMVFNHPVFNHPVLNILGLVVVFNLCSGLFWNVSDVFALFKLGRVEPTDLWFSPAQKEHHGPQQVFHCSILRFVSLQEVSFMLSPGKPLPTSRAMAASSPGDAPRKATAKVSGD